MKMYVALYKGILVISPHVIFHPNSNRKRERGEGIECKLRREESINFGVGLKGDKEKQSEEI